MPHPYLPSSLLTPFLLLAGIAPAERVQVTLTQQTTFGDSVFVSFPEMEGFGGGEMLRAAKMIPANYPEWSLQVDLPAGVSVTPRFFLRGDAPSQLANPANGSVLREGEPILTPPSPDPRPQRLHIHAPGTSVSAYFDADPGTPYPAQDAGNGWQVVDIPAQRAALGGTLRLRLGESVVPASGEGFRLHGRETWWRHNQAFHYQPGDSPPSSPREVTFSYEPLGFPARTIRVLLPRGYDQHPDRTYPVLYAMDGQNLLSTYTGPRFGSWDLDLTLRDLIARGEIPEVILVGVDNTNIRHIEYTPSWGTVFGDVGRAEEFLADLEQRFIPEVESRFRATPQRNQRVFLGSSLGGLAGFEAAHHHREAWGTIVAMSPSTQVTTSRWLEYSARPSSLRSRLWIDSGTGGGSADGYPNTVQVRDTLLTVGGEALGPRFFHLVGLGDSHNEAAWKRRSPDALRWAFLPEEMTSSAPEVWLLYANIP